MFWLALQSLWRLVRRHGQATLWTAFNRPASTLVRVPSWLPWFVVLIVIALWAVPLGALFKAAQSWRHFRDAYAVYARELWFSLPLTGAAALICTFAGCWAARVITLLRRGRRLAHAWLMLMLCTPAPVLGVGLTLLFNRPGLLGMIYDSPLILVLADVLRALPVAVLLLLPALQRIPRAYDELAALEGTGAWMRWRVYLLPLCWRSLLATWFLVFIVCMAEIGAAVLVAPPGRTTLTIRYFNLIHYGMYADAASLCLMLLLMVLLPAAAAMVVAAKGRQGS